MKTCDLIEAAEEPLDVVLPLDADQEMAEHFSIFSPIVVDFL